MQFLSIFTPNRVEQPCQPLVNSEKPPVVALHDINKVFHEADQARIVLEDVSLSVEEGEFVVLLGHSGSGKSTLLNLISGIERPTSGCVSIQDVAISNLRERERTLYRRDNIGFIFQFFNLISTLTVLENVTLPQELAGRDAQSQAESLLQEVGLGDRFDTFPDKLSGGEQQRVAIARALVHDPMLVLADEPTGNLDEAMGQLVLNLLLRLTRDQGKSLIMATHNPQIADLADRVITVHDRGVQEKQNRE